MVINRLSGGECADTSAPRRKSVRGGSTMASLPSTSAAASTLDYCSLRFDRVWVHEVFDVGLVGQGLLELNFAC